MKRPETNKFTLNEEKNRKSDKHQTHRGVLDIDGKLYWIGGWYNDGNYGTYFKGDVRLVTDDEIAKYFSNNTQDSQIPKPMAKPVVIEEDFDDELPF